MRRHLLAAVVALGLCGASLGLTAGDAFARGSGAAHRSAIAASAQLYLHGAFVVHHRTVDVPGRAMRVTGVVRPYVPGQTVTLRAYLGRRLIAGHRLRVRPTGSRRAGTFVATVTAAHAGIVHLTAVHRRGPRMRGFTVSRGVDALAPDTGSTLFASLVQQRLARLHVYVPETGRWDLHTALAIDAYHRLLGRGTSQSLDGSTLSALLDGSGAFRVRYPHDGRHVEGDLGHQLLALIQGSRVQEIYPISSGKPSTPTILGRFRVYLRTPGYLPDGMYYSDFFIRGYAIHGYDPAPDYPASHGCMRLPISDALPVWHWLSIGVRVDVYE